MGLLIFQNDSCLVINKLPGESSESPLVEGAGDFIFPVHRLDTPVSGCLLIAKTQGAATFLGSAFKRHNVKKTYWAIIEKPEKEFPEEGELVNWIKSNPRDNKSFALPWSETPPLQKSRGEPKPKKAVLQYRVIGKGENYLFLEIDLVTGRHHQIRAQLAAIGLHVKGDLKYGARRSEKAGGIRLHAYSLDFPNPLNAAEIITVKAPPPLKDNLWEAFESSILRA